MAIPALTTPTAPGRPVARVSGARGVGLIWTPPADTGGSAITGYEVQLEREGDEQGWSAIPGSGADTRSYTFRAGRAGNLFTETAAVAPGSIDDTGLRATFTDDADTDARGRQRLTIRPPVRIPVLGQTARNVLFVQARVPNLRIDFAPASGNVALDLDAEAEAHWAWAVQVAATGQVWGAFYLRDDILRVGRAGPVPSDPYVTPWPAGQDYTHFDLARQLGASCRVILYDPRPGAVSGENADFGYDTTLRRGERHRFRVRAVNAQGGGAPSEWSGIVIPASTSTGRLPLAVPREAAGDSEEPPSVLTPDTRRVVVWPGETTSYTVSAPTSAGPLEATAQIAVVGPHAGRSPLDGVVVELGECDAAGVFTPASDATFSPIPADAAPVDGELNYIAQTLRWEVHGHTEAEAEVTVRAPTLAAARAFRSAAFLRVSGVSGRREDVWFLGALEHEKGSIIEEGENHTWLVELTAATGIRRASKALLAGAPVTDETADIHEGGVRRFVGEVGDLLYRREDLPVNHLRLGVDETGPVLFADSREWPAVPVHVQSAVRRPLSYADAARAIGDALDQGWQMAADGFYRPLLHQHFPAAVLDPLDGLWDIRIHGVSATSPANRQFGEIPLPADATRPLRSNARHYRIPDSDDFNPDDYVPAAGDFDHRPGQVLVEREWYGVYNDEQDANGCRDNSTGRRVKFIRLFILDPGGHGSRYPLPALVEPELVRVGVVRAQETGTFEVDEDLADGERTWVLTPTHLERIGVINDAALTAARDGNPWVAAGTGAAQRSEQSGWRFAVRADIIDKVPSPVAVSWKSFRPEWIGRTVDIRGYPGAAGGLKVVRLAARVHSITEDGVVVEWTVTALQSAALEESMDGTEFLRELRRGVEEGE